MYIYFEQFPLNLKKKNDIVMLYGDVNKSDKVLLYRLPKGTCLLND